MESNARIDFTKYNEKAIIYLDLLGIKAFIDKYEKIAPERIHQIYEAILRIIDFRHGVLSLDGVTFNFKDFLEPYYNISALSDSIIMTLELERIELLPVLLRWVYISQINFLLKDVPLRGYITIGKCFHDNTRGIIFGSGLISAFNQEREHVVYPRVVIDEKVFYRLEKIYKKPSKDFIDKYQALYPNTSIRDLDSLFHLAGNNFINSVTKDTVTDNRWVTQLENTSLIQQHYRNLRTVDELTLKEFLIVRVAGFEKLYAETKDKKIENVMKKWQYLKAKLIPVIDSIFPN